MGLPFIHLVKSPLSHYFYEVNRNEIVSIEENVYKALRAILREDTEITFDEKTEAAIQSLRVNGYLSDYRPKEIEHPATPLLSYYLTHKVRKMILQVTQNCNFRCTYCVYSENLYETQRSHSSKKMSWETARKAVDFYMEHSRDVDQIKIGFYGGEPLLEFELIKKVIAYADEVFDGKEIIYSITTNGSLLTDSVVEYLASHNISVTISLDGAKEIHDTSRRFASDGRGSFDIIMSNIENIKKKYPGFAKKLGISMVVDPQNDYDKVNQIFFDDEKFSGLTVHSTPKDDVNANEKTIFSDKYLAKSRYQMFLSCLSKLGWIEKEFVSPMNSESLQNILNRTMMLEPIVHLPEKTNPSGACVPGTRLFVSVDGIFSLCERVNEESSAMQIGNLLNGFDLQKAYDVLNIGRLTQEHCQNCWAINFCNLCAKHADNNNSLSAELKLTHCSNVYNSAENDLKAMILFKELANI